ncbi:TPA: metal-dependent transcriptional regulator [Candidatus Geothermarchaeota archaeon]|nr:metal-dependent transcriptional regulator [Candidatus Geothermarchaeota archaeon]HIQ12972.1 metal-dependent transcriptional regulator [Thermoprotei archaeon]
MRDKRIEMLRKAHRLKKMFGSMAEEDYIEVIYELERVYGSASPSDIASILGVKPSSVTNMLRKLEEKGYIEYRKYRSPKLTMEGLELAKSISSKHRRIYEILRAVGVDDERANIEAELAEHFLSDDTIEKLYLFYRGCIKFLDESKKFK